MPVRLTTNDKRKKRGKPTTAQTPEDVLFGEVRIGAGRRKRALDEAQRTALIQLMAMKGRAATDPSDIAPPGSFIAKVLRHFQQTDISYSLPFIGLLTIAASKLIQMGASVDIPGVGNIRPTVWNCLLASSGSAKTLAIDELFRIMSEPGESAPVKTMPIAGSDAQWIVGLEENNGSFWFQDEVGKYFKKVSTDSNFRRMKPWLLDAYSHKPVSNSLKTAASSNVDCPHFTFLGMTVTETWSRDIDADSMLDGFAQRFMYTIAPARTDCDTFDFLLYFEGAHVEEDRAEMREIWQALCAQPGIEGPYVLNDEVLPFLRLWWKRLRESWGKTSVPGSFVRRIGFSVFRYLPVIHMLLGKCRWKIDVETAEICTQICEVHFESALELLNDYDRATAEKVQKVAEVREDVIANGLQPTTRNITRRFSKAQREAIPKQHVEAITAALAAIDDVPDLIAGNMSPKEKSAALVGRFDEIQERLQLNARKRNERRLREVVALYRADQHAAEYATEHTEMEAEEEVITSDGDDLIEQGVDNVVKMSAYDTRRTTMQAMLDELTKPSAGSAGDDDDIFGGEDDEVIERETQITQGELPLVF